MAYKIIETALAGQDLDSIISYIALSLENPSAAAAFADAVEKCYSELEEMPMMFAFSATHGSALWGIIRLSSKTMSWSIRLMKPPRPSLFCDSFMEGRTMKN